MVREDAERALDAFARKAGIGSLRFDQSGTALLAFGENQELIFYYSEKAAQIEIWSPLTDLMVSGEVNADAALMQHLLEKNFPASTLNGAYFAIDGEMGVVLLGRAVYVDGQSDEVFGETVTAFAQQVMVIAETITKDVASTMAARKAPDATDTETPIIKA